MATINPVSSRPDLTAMEQVLWETLTQADTAAGYESRGREGNLQVIGTFGGATVILQGSNDGTNWFALKDRYGAAISLILIVIGIIVALALWRMTNMKALLNEPRIEVQ